MTDKPRQWCPADMTNLTMDEIREITLKAKDDLIKVMAAWLVGLIITVIGLVVILSKVSSCS